MPDTATASFPPETAAGTLGQQLAARIAERIRRGALSPGARLPSVREGARLHGVSPSTVVSAYDQLQAQGLVEARRQRGFYVREPSEQEAVGGQGNVERENLARVEGGEPRERRALS